MKLLTKTESLSFADSTGLAGFQYSGMAILCPTGKKKDAVTGKMESPLSIRYKKPVGGGSKGWYKLWETGANASNPTDDQLVRKMHIQSEEGIQTFGAARFIKVTKAS
jgi:hypothetical protein